MGGFLRKATTISVAMHATEEVQVSALIILFAVTFLLGSIPWGLVISKLVYKKDLRSEGSGNIGTTNAMRSLGKKGGAAVFLLDFGKGLLSGFLGMQVAAWTNADESTLALCLAISFIGCTWGHIFSPWLKFKGGKGIAVAVGALFFVFGPVGALLELSLFIVLVVATRYVSLGSVAAAAACPFFSLYYFWGEWIAVALCCITACTVVWAHRGNIQRLLAGNERRIGQKKEAIEEQ